MFISSKEIATMIKIDNLIKSNQEHLFGEDLKKIVKSTDGTDITFEDSVDYTNIVVKTLAQRLRLAKRKSLYNKRDRELHNLYNNRSNAKIKGDAEKYIYWTQKIEEYKNKKKGMIQNEK